MVRLAAFLIVFCLAAVPARAQTPWLLVLEVVGQLGTAVGNLADGIGKAVDAGLEIHDEARLRSLRAAVLALNDRIARLTAKQTILTERLDEHAADRQPVETWEDIRRHLDEIAPAIQSLIVSLDELGPRLIEIAGPQAIHDLRTTLRSRISLVARLRGLEAPRTDEEKAALAELIDRYRTLIVNLQKLNQALFEHAHALGEGSG